MDEKEVCLSMEVAAASIGLSRPSGVWVRQKRGRSRSD